MKKWYLSKTILVAMLMEALAQVTLHMDEVKESIASHTNTDTGLMFAIVFPAVMVMMRFITTEPINGGKKNVQESNGRDDRNDQDMDDSGADDRDGDDGVVGILPKPLGDSDTGGGENNPHSDDQSKRGTNTRARHRRRVKRRR